MSDAQTNSQLADIKTDLATITEHLRTIDQRLGAVDKRLDAVDKRFDAVDKRFDAVDKRFDAVDKRFDAVDERFDGVDDELTAAKVRDEELHRLMKFGLEAREVLRESVERKLTSIEHKHDEEIGLLKEVVSHQRHQSRASSTKASRHFNTD